MANSSIDTFRFPQSMLRFSTVQASLALHSPCTTFRSSLFTFHSPCACTERKSEGLHQSRTREQLPDAPRTQRGRDSPQQRHMSKCRRTPTGRRISRLPSFTHQLRPQHVTRHRRDHHTVRSLRQLPLCRSHTQLDTLRRLQDPDHLQAAAPARETERDIHTHRR